MRVSFAARASKPSRLTWTPGTITPPKYSPFGEMQSNVVAVPKSTTMTPALMRSYAATALTMRSAPTSRGFSYSTGIPVLSPGPTTNGSRANAWRIASAITSVSGGTTLAMIAASMASLGTLRSASNCWSITPYSSSVRVVTVETRNVCSSVRPRYSPNTTFVLPMSTARSMAELLALLLFSGHSQHRARQSGQARRKGLSVLGADGHMQNAVTGGDAIPTWASFAEPGVFAVQLRVTAERYEELTRPRVAPRERHPNRAHLESDGRGFTAQWRFVVPAVAVTRGIAELGHEPGYHAVHEHPVVEAGLHKRGDALGRARGQARV